MLDNLGYNVSALLAGLGIGGIAVALALQNVLGDLFASLSITLDKPFVTGDFIIVGDLLGTVSHVGLKTTRAFEERGIGFAYPTRTLHVAADTGPALVAVAGS